MILLKIQIYQNLYFKFFNRITRAPLPPSLGNALSILAKEKVVNEGLKERINELERENEKLRARKQKSSDKK